MARGGTPFSAADEELMRRALRLAQRGFGGTSPNPLVGAVVARDGKMIAEGWHRRAGEAHAEIRAIENAKRKALQVKGATLYVTLEPCSTHGRTPPCTRAIIESGFARVVVAATDPNPKHAGAGFAVLRQSGIRLDAGLLAEEALNLNEAFNHWVVTRRPFVTLKWAMSLDGKIATNSGESKWITGEKARSFGMRLRLGADAIVAGVNTVVRDDPALSLRTGTGIKIPSWKTWRRVILDPLARIPLTARVLNENPENTMVVVSEEAPLGKRMEIEKRVRVMVAPKQAKTATLNLRWLLRMLGGEGITALLVEGGGETHARFLAAGLVNRVCCFFAPMIISGREAPKAVAGERTLNRPFGLRLRHAEWKKFGADLLLSGLLERGQK